MKLGRRKADPARYARMISLALTGTIPPYPQTADHLKTVKTWVLGANDRFGVCGPVSVANFLVMLYRNILGEDITVTNAAIFDLYKRSGNPDFDPTTGAGDNGVDMTTMLDALLKGGIGIVHADGSKETVKPLCYAKLPLDIATQRAATAIFGAPIWGVDLQSAQQTQAVLWDYKPSGNWGGHAIPGGAYKSDPAKGHEDFAIVSWQQRYGVTDAFVTHQLAEAYVPVFAPLWQHPNFIAGVDQAALAADYKALTGRDFPIPIPPPVPHLRITLDIDTATGKAVQV